MTAARAKAAFAQAETFTPEPPRPLRREVAPAEPFPIDALGDLLGPAAKGIHDRTKAPVAICGQAVLAVAALAVQAHADVQLPTLQVRPTSEFFISVADLRRLSLEVGSDGRNRTSLMPFWTKSARNQPGSTKFIFAPSKWFRGLVKPTPGYGLAYIDYIQQELAIAAALSGDQAMMEAYLSRDFYLEFARQAGAIPDDTTEEDRGIIRAAYKTCALGVLYGMGRNLLAARTGKTIDEAARLLSDHRRSFRRFWEWNDEIICRARTAGCIETNRGWRLHVTSTEPNDCTLKNFPMQAHGAEMMREAACLAIEAGIRVCAPIHDAFLIEVPVDRLDCEIERMRACMAAASREILDGFEVRTDLKVVRYPDRLMEPEGRAMWDKVMTLLEEVELN